MTDREEPVPPPPEPEPPAPGHSPSPPFDSSDPPELSDRADLSDFSPAGLPPPPFPHGTPPDYRHAPLEREASFGYRAPDYHSRPQWWPSYLFAALLLFGGSVGGMVLGGALGQFMLTGLEVLPFALLALLTYLGVERVWARAAAGTWLLLLLSSVALVALGMTALGWGPVGEGGVRPPPPYGTTSHVLWVILSNVLAVCLSVLCVAPPVRRLLSRWLPIQPDSFAHAIALSLVVGCTVIGLGQLIAANGKPPILVMIRANPKLLLDQDLLLSTVWSLVWMVPGSLVAVGFPVLRSLGDAARRLGLVRPTVGQVASAVVLAGLLVGAGHLLDPRIEAFWKWMGWPRTDVEAFEALMKSLTTPVGAVAIGISAGLGEELVVRGALQPRLGIWLSNLFFTSLHAFQYSWDALLSVFLVGMVLGVVRARTNTTTSAVVHGVYDFILVMMAALESR